MPADKNRKLKEEQQTRPIFWMENERERKLKEEQQKHEAESTWGEAILEIVSWPITVPSFLAGAAVETAKRLLQSQGKIDSDDARNLSKRRSAPSVMMTVGIMRSSVLVSGSARSREFSCFAITIRRVNCIGAKGAARSLCPTTRLSVGARFRLSRPMREGGYSDLKTFRTKFLCFANDSKKGSSLVS